MEHTFHTHLYFQALSNKEQRLAFIQPGGPHEAKKAPAEAQQLPQVNPATETTARANQLARRLPEGKERQQQSWKNVRSVLEKSFGAPSTVQGDSAHSIVLMFEEAKNVPSCPVYLKDGTLYERQESILFGTRMSHQSTYFTRPLVPHFDALFLVNPATAIDTLSKVNSESTRPETRVFIEAIASALKRDSEAVSSREVPVTPVPDPTKPSPAPATKPTPETPDEKTAKEAQEATEKAKKAETEKYEREKAAQEKAAREAAEKALNDKVERFVKDNQATIDDLNKFDKENNKEKFAEKLGELNKKVDDIKDPAEKTKVLEALKTKLSQTNFKVKVEAKLVIDEPKVAPTDVKTAAPELNSIEKFREYIKIFLETLATTFGYKNLKEMGDAYKNMQTAQKAGEIPPTADINKRLQAIEAENAGLRKAMAGAKRGALGAPGRPQSGVDMNRLQNQVNQNSREIETLKVQKPIAERQDRQVVKSVAVLDQQGRRYGYTVETDADKRVIRLNGVMNPLPPASVQVIREYFPYYAPVYDRGGVTLNVRTMNTGNNNTIIDSTGNNNVQGNVDKSSTTDIRVAQASVTQTQVSQSVNTAPKVTPSTTTYTESSGGRRGIFPILRRRR